MHGLRITMKNISQLTNPTFWIALLDDASHFHLATADLRRLFCGDIVYRPHQSVVSAEANTSSWP